jgi:hypothetical protein
LFGFFGRTAALLYNNVEKLLFLVQERRYLWDQRDPDISEDCIETGTDNNTTQSESNDSLYTPDFPSDMQNTTSDPSRDNDAPINKSPAQKKKTFQKSAKKRKENK